MCKNVLWLKLLETHTASVHVTVDHCYLDWGAQVGALKSIDEASLTNTVSMSWNQKRAHQFRLEPFAPTTRTRRHVH